MTDRPHATPDHLLAVLEGIDETLDVRLADIADALRDLALAVRRPDIVRTVAGATHRPASRTL